jgi:hypothetical protein
MNKSTLKALTLMAVTGLISGHHSNETEHQSSSDPAVARINADVEQIARYELIMATTLPDAIEQNWDLLEGALKEEVNSRIEIASNKIKNKALRYKVLMEKAIIQGAVAKEAFEGANVNVTNVDTACDMNCVQYCFSTSLNRFENATSIYNYCLVPTCNCRTGEVTYREHENYSG